MDNPDVADAGGSVTLMVFAAAVAVSPAVVFVAVTVNVFVGCPFPLKVECSVSPLFTSAAAKV